MCGIDHDGSFNGAVGRPRRDWSDRLRLLTKVKAPSLMNASDFSDLQAHAEKTCLLELSTSAFSLCTSVHPSLSSECGGHRQFEIGLTIGADRSDPCAIDAVFKLAALMFHSLVRRRFDSCDQGRSSQYRRDLPRTLPTVAILASTTHAESEMLQVLLRCRLSAAKCPAQKSHHADDQQHFLHLEKVGQQGRELDSRSQCLS